jgi:hypothetical protein
MRYDPASRVSPFVPLLNAFTLARARLRPLEG